MTVMLMPIGRPLRMAASAAALLCVAAAVFAAPDKTLLALKGEPGEITRYKTTSKMELTADGEKMTFESSEEQEVKLLRKEGANFVMDSTTLSATMSVNGEKIEPQEDSKPQGGEMVLKPNGELVSYKDKDEESDAEGNKLSMRMLQASSLIFSASPVGVGDAWSHAFAENKDLQTYAGKADFKLVAFETLGGVKVAKIEFSYSESGADKNIKTSGVNYVEIETGDVIKSETKYENVPFDFGSGEDMVATSTDTTERTFFSKAAQTPPAEAKKDDAKKDEPKKDDAKKEEPKKEEDKNSIDVKTKGWEKMEGLFTLYRKVDGGRTRMSLEIKKSQLNKLFVLQTTFSTGSGSRIVPGNPISDLVFELREMPNNKIFLAVPNFYWQAGKNKAIAKAIKRSFTDSVVDSFDIDATQKERDSVLIDVSSFFTGNIGRVLETVSSGGGSLAALMGGSGGFSLDRDKTYIEELKVFPTNLFCSTVFAFSSGSGRDGYDSMGIFEGSVPERADSRSLIATVNYNLYQLPVDSGYQPRRADNRVGYFNVVHRDWSRPEAMDQKVENIVRWDLRRKDPLAAVSEPVQPVVFWVDSAFSPHQQEVVQKALLSWNKAFERLGLKNAIVVKLMDDKTEFDHADMRYNVVRLVASPGDAYAVALFRANPITGQILNASITLDANFLRAIEGDWQRISPAEAFAQPRFLVDATPEQRQAYFKAHALQCSFEQEAAKRAAFGALALSLSDPAVGKDRKNEFADSYLYHVIQHEFGHILGLRHNFVASTQLTPAQLMDPEMVNKHNVTASVMDYVDFNTFAIGHKNVPFFGHEVGDYDSWAIRYGYLPTGIADPDSDAKFLKAIAAQGSKWGLEFQTDEQADGLDPYVRRFDLSADPVAENEFTISLCHRLLLSLGDRLPKGGDSYFEFTRAFDILLARMANAAGETSLFLGGVRRSFAHSGDPGARKPYTPVSGAVQKRALNALLGALLDEKSFDFPKSYYRMFAGNPKGSSMESSMDAYDTYPMFDQIARLQSQALSVTMSPSLLRQLINEDWKAEPGQDVLKASEVMKKVRDSVWVELDQNRSVSSLRRALQRTHVDRLIELGVKQDAGRSDVNVMAWSQLRALGAKLKAVKAPDEATALHYEELSNRISRALNAIQTIGASGGSSRTLSLADLLGGAKP